ncbi:hypothetical protein T4A_5570 [Trichinella pseudospiralis]|uniref:Uncharacterized protein n=1 Tax=Trichinella pseudospiralis TaxID=6337 RepID=A0A0V1EQQ0_TRIPS|nr:hypothetical protein T4A_5570 [Trichinella pseudospiralis]
MGEQCFDIGLIVQLTNGHLTKRLLIPGDTADDVLRYQNARKQ